MATNEKSAEIYELSDARARLQSLEVDPKNFVSVGAYLSAVREHLGLSLGIVSEQTHIKQHFLEAIEAMKIDALPSKPFAIGFVKGFAEALELDPQPVVDRFKQEAGFGERRVAASADVAEPSAPPADATARPELSFLAVLGVLAFMIWCAFWITRPGDPSQPLRLDGLPSPSSPGGGAAIMTPEDAAKIAALEADPSFVAPEVVEARILERIEPIYPLQCEARADGAESVSVTFTITEAGRVSNERVANSTNACFNREALNALRLWRFAPQTVNGEARPAFDQQATFRFDRPA